jgi:hypothetical protein
LVLWVERLRDDETAQARSVLEEAAREFLLPRELPAAVGRWVWELLHAATLHFSFPLEARFV